MCAREYLPSKPPARLAAVATLTFALGLVSPSAHAAEAAPRSADAAEATADETMTVTAERKGKGHDRILATPTPEGRASTAGWLSHRHARCNAIYAAEGRTLRVHKILPTNFLQWQALVYRFRNNGRHAKKRRWSERPAPLVAAGRYILHVSAAEVRQRPTLRRHVVCETNH